jgi:hypothetical protein
LRWRCRQEEEGEDGKEKEVEGRRGREKEEEE